MSRLASRLNKLLCSTTWRNRREMSSGTTHVERTADSSRNDVTQASSL